MEPKLSIIIVNFQSEKFLTENLRSISENFPDDICCEIIIVNNDAKESLNGIKMNFPTVKIISSGKNMGFGPASNLGAEKANGEILFFLNPDTKILSKNIADVIKLFNNKDISAVGSGLVTERGEKQSWSAGREINLINTIKNNIFSRSNNTSEKTMEAAWVSGAAMFFRLDVFEKLAGFDESFFMYFEDVDLCRRARKTGYKIIFFPDFKVLHKGGESYGNKSEQKKNYYASQEYYFKKHCGSAQTILLKLFRYFFK